MEVFQLTESASAQNCAITLSTKCEPVSIVSLLIGKHMLITSWKNSIDVCTGFIFLVELEYVGKLLTFTIKNTSIF